MVTGETVHMLKDHPVARPHDEDPALLPEITGMSALAESLAHGLESPAYGLWTQGFEETPLKSEGPVDLEIFVHVDFSGETGFFRKGFGLGRRRASNHHHLHACPLQLFFHVRKGSTLLPSEHSPEMP